MRAVILAAGRGTRLGPLTAHHSKAMLFIAGRPMIGRVIDRLRAAGLSRFVIVHAPDDQELVNFVSAELGENARLAPQLERRGTADALAAAAPYLDGPFLVTPCDDILPESHLVTLIATLRPQEGIDGVLTIQAADPQMLSRTSSVVLKGSRVRRIVEKPPPGTAPSNFAGIMTYAFTPRILELLPGLPPSPRGEVELTDAVQCLLDAGAVILGVETPWRLTLTYPEDIARLEAYFSR